VTIREAAEALRLRSVSSVELTTAALSRVDRLNGPLCAFITITGDAALESARQADRELAAGKDRGPLHGIPIAYKDLFLTKGVRTTGGSKLYENFVPDVDAAVVERLRDAGAVSLGKLNQHELAYGITSANPHFGAVRNPWDRERSPGGSSGGSGAAVASGMVYAAMGSDTGGSIRIPASWCGTVGLKPTYGRVSKFGTLPLGYSLDHMGPLARSVRDCAAVLNAIAGFDARDETSSTHPTVDYVPEDGCSIRGMRVGFAESFYFDGLDADVESSVRGAIARAESLGAAIVPVQTPDIAALNAIGQVILLSEASAALDQHLGDRSNFGEDVWRLLNQGRLIAATDYIQAQRLRRRMSAEFERLWNEVDCLILPATPLPAPKIGDVTVRLAGKDTNVRMAATRLVRGINVLGLPALSMPCGLSGNGMPVGLQIVGPAFAEASILNVGAALEDGGVGIPPCPIT